MNIQAVPETFLTLRNLDDLSLCLRVPYYPLLKILDDSQEDYRVFKIRKRNGDYRQIEAPSKPLKEIQQRLNFHLQRSYLQSRAECVHGFVSNFGKKLPTRNITTNAAVHVGAQQVLNMDIENFFPSIDVWRVKQIFCSYPFYFGNNLASHLAILTTHNSKLPMGAPTSPVISNFACFLLDRKLMRFAIKNKLQYTRYADDLTFSSKENFPEDVVQQISSILESEQFKVNEAKTRIFSNKGRQTVTGLKVNTKVNVDRRFVRSIRAMLHKWKTQGLATASRVNRSEFEFINILKGKLNFLKMVKGEEDGVYKNLFDKFRMLDALATQKHY